MTTSSRRAAMVVSHDDNFDEIYKERFRKYCLLLSKEKELMQRMSDVRTRSSTLNNSNYELRRSLQFPESYNHDKFDETFLIPDKNLSISLKDLRIKHQTDSSEHVIRKLSTKYEDELDGNNVEDDDEFGRNEKLNSCDRVYHRKGVRDDDMSSHTTFKKHSIKHSVNNTTVMKAEGKPEENLDRHSKQSYKRLKNESRKQSRGSFEELNISTRKKSIHRECSINFEEDKDFLIYRSDSNSSGEENIALFGLFRRKSSLPPENSFHYSHSFEQLSELAKRKNSLLGFKSNALQDSYSSKSKLVTSSLGNLHDDNVRHLEINNNKPKTLRSSNESLERRLAKARLKSLKRTEVMRQLDDDFTKANTLIKEYKSTDNLTK